MVSLTAKPAGHEHVQLTFKVASLFCGADSFVDAVNAEVKKGKFWTVTAPAIKAYDADVYHGTDAMYCDVIVFTYTGSLITQTWGEILKPLLSFYGSFTCFAASGEAITLTDAKIVPTNSPPSAAAEYADSTTVKTNQTRTTEENKPGLPDKLVSFASYLAWGAGILLAGYVIYTYKPFRK